MSRRQREGDALLSAPPAPIDDARIAVVGFSAGGLATLLASADDHRIRVWVGLDPVDRNGRGVAAAPRVRARPVIVRADPSPCNANGKAADIGRAFGGRETVVAVAGASRTDPEWPTDWKARLFCGGDDEARRARFVAVATPLSEGRRVSPMSPEYGVTYVSGRTREIRTFASARSTGPAPAGRRRKVCDLAEKRDTFPAIRWSDCTQNCTHPDRSG